MGRIEFKFVLFLFYPTPLYILYIHTCLYLSRLFLKFPHPVTKVSIPFFHNGTTSRYEKHILFFKPDMHKRQTIDVKAKNVGRHQQKTLKKSVNFFLKTKPCDGFKVFENLRLSPLDIQKALSLQTQRPRFLNKSSEERLL